MSCLPWDEQVKIPASSGPSLQRVRISCNKENFNDYEPPFWAPW